MTTSLSPLALAAPQLDATFLLGATVAIVGACVSIPQTVRMLRRRDIAGLSITSYVAWTLSWALWAGYSLQAGALPKAASESVGFIAEAVLLATLVAVAGRAGVVGLGKGVLAALPGLALIVAAGWMWGPVGFALALTIFDAAYLLPQVRATIKSPSLSGLSLWSYGLRALVASGWIAYGWALGRPEVGGWGYVIAPFAIYVFARVVTDRRRASTLEPEPPSRTDVSAASGADAGQERTHP